MGTTRRQFLQGGLLLALGMAAPTGFCAFAQDQTALPPTLTADTAALRAYRAALETPHDAPLNFRFSQLLGDATVGLVLYDLNAGRLLAGLQTEKPLPVASAFKAGTLLYFLRNVDESVWAGVPVAYWNTASANDVPEAHRDSFKVHRAVLRDLYNSLVMSGNETTGAVLGYVARTLGRQDALAAFNDWLTQVVGVSQLSGLSTWTDGVPAGMTATDARFDGRGTTLNGGITRFDNLMTPRDLGLLYAWMLAETTPAELQVCNDLLSTIFNNRGANLERLATENTGTPFSKNGSLDTPAGYVVTDAGVLAFLDGRRYLLSVMSLGAPTRIGPLFEELGHTLRGRYNEEIHSHHYDGVRDDELLDIYTAHLAAAYPQQADALPGQVRYGFVMPNNVKVYSAPNDTSMVHNPIIKTTRFSVNLLMQGALARYMVVDRDWAELVPDNTADNVRVRLAPRVFVRRVDLWPISLDYAAPISYISNPSVTPEDKYVVITLASRELYAFEGDQLVLRVPIVLNPDATPRGAQVITSKWFARSMQPWAPGVPFTAFFGAEGYALHGAPWQRWDTTVNQTTIVNRSSAGCVNIPNWLVTSSNHTRPADELLFRWVGGIEQPRDAVFEYPTETNPALRIYNVDYAPNLRGYVRPAALHKRGMTWDDVIDLLETRPLQAPSSFFV
jgi:hypothetical protein